MSFFRRDGTVQTVVGQALSGLEIYVCSQPATTNVVPPSPLINLYAAPTSNSVAVNSATWELGVLEFVLASLPTDLVVNSYIQVSGANPAAFNGVYQVQAVDPTSNTVTLALPANPGTYVSGASVATSVLPNPVISDGNGNYFFYAPTGVYTIVIVDPLGNVATTIFTDQEVTSPGGGTVTSVAVTGDGIIFASSVTGSPIDTAGTIDLLSSLLTQGALTVLAGPLSGGAATPTFKNLSALLTAAGAGSGTVTSVGISTSGTSALFSFSVASGSPVTGAGTIVLVLNFVNQAANTFLAGPTSGGSGPVSARKAVAADICGTVVVSFSTTPVFDASQFALPTFLLTLTGNVASSTVSNPITGQRITFMLAQDGTGSRTFAWPANFKGASPVGPDANSVTVQAFVYDGTNFRADGAGLTTGS